MLAGQATDASMLFATMDETDADLVLIDRHLPGMDIDELIGRLHMLEPRPVVIVMSSYSGDSEMLLRIGADAFVSKADHPEWLLNLLRKRAKTLP